MPPEPKPPPPPGRKWIWFFAAPVGVAALAAFLYGYFVGFNVAVKPGDREIVVTIDDVKPLPEGITKVDSAEKLTRLVHTDGSKEVSYEYDTTQAARPTIPSAVTGNDELRQRFDEEVRQVGTVAPAPLLPVRAHVRGQPIVVTNAEQARKRSDGLRGVRVPTELEVQPPHPHRVCSVLEETPRVGRRRHGVDPRREAIAEGACPRRHQLRQFGGHEGARHTGFPRRRSAHQFAPDRVRPG